jgi:hypothetical protein
VQKPALVRPVSVTPIDAIARVGVIRADLGVGRIGSNCAQAHVGQHLYAWITALEVRDRGACERVDVPDDDEVIGNVVSGKQLSLGVRLEGDHRRPRCRDSLGRVRAVVALGVAGRPNDREQPRQGGEEK